MTSKLLNIISQIQTLSPQEYFLLQREIAPFAVEKTDIDTEENKRFDNGRVCPYCGCLHIVRNGHRKTDNAQRFLCKDCNKSFVTSSNSIVFKTHKSLDTWCLYAQCMIGGMSLRECAEECEISLRTSFLWRHKILDNLQNMQNNVKLNGIIEADETFFDISYKGNHKKNPSFNMGRLPHKRGKDKTYILDEVTKEKVLVKTKRGLSNDKVCVPCATTRSGASIAKIGKTGKVNIQALNKVFGDRITDNSTLCTDKEKAYRKFSVENGIKLVQLDNPKQQKNGIYNIQKINSFHSGLKKFLYPMNGVSTKYLNNYLVWYNFLSNTKGNRKYKEKSLYNFIIKQPFYETLKSIPDREPVPILI